MVSSQEGQKKAKKKGSKAGLKAKMQHSTTTSSSIPKPDKATAKSKTKIFKRPKKVKIPRGERKVSRHNSNKSKYNNKKGKWKEVETFEASEKGDDVIDAVVATEATETKALTEATKPATDSPSDESKKSDWPKKAPKMPSKKKRAGTSPTPQSRHPFSTDAADHCETPLEAYKHILPLINELAKKIGKTKSTLKIYDPYYCDGGVKTKLGSLGFTNVINENRDFYKDIKDDTVPSHDVLLTNPPYSGKHMDRILEFAIGSGKPFLLLLPHFVYTKNYFHNKNVDGIMFLVPKARYSYTPPSWVSAEEGSNALAKGKSRTAPFPSFWYFQTAQNQGDEEVSPPQLIEKPWLEGTFGASGKYAKNREVHFAEQSLHIPRDFKADFDLSKKRAGSKARKKAAKKRKAQKSKTKATAS